MKDFISYIQDLRFNDLPVEVVAQAKRCIIDWVAVTIGGVGHPASAILIDTVQLLGGAEQASVLGTPLKTSMLNAALVNGALSHVLDFDDTHLPSLMHPTAPVAPALTAYGEWRGCSGEDFLTAFLAGFEVETRLSMAFGASHYDIGWHSTATMGRFGAAAGAAKLAGLDAQQTAHALGLAGTQVSGIRKVFGTMAKSFHPGKAAADGLLSALLAQRGYTSSPEILEGERGLGAILSADFDLERGKRGLGRDYTVMTLTFKPFASCLYTHPVIDGTIYLRDRYGIKPEDVERIECRVSKFCFDAACQKTPRTGLAGKFSTYFCVALALVEGRAGEDLFEDQRTEDPAIRALMDRVEVIEVPALSERQAELTFHLRNGKSYNHPVRHPLGDPGNPLDDKQIEEKARSLLVLRFSKDRTDAILQQLKGLETVRDIGELTSLLRTLEQDRKASVG
jgi:2-methylcitrate dehydratase PrpD